MITIKIAEQERRLDSIDPQWINQQINRCKEDGQPVCVRVSIRAPGIDIALATPTCGAGGGGGRPLSTAERHIVDLWTKLGLGEHGFTGGNVVAFLNQLKRMF